MKKSFGATNILQFWGGLVEVKERRSGLGNFAISVDDWGGRPKEPLTLLDAGVTNIS